MSSRPEKLIIIDGNALIHRSFHALPPTMMTKAGEPTNAVYGFVSVLLKAIKEFKPEYIALTLDRKAPTFRHEEYKEYKATRVKAPDELYAQIPRVKEVAEVLGIPLYEKDGFEADDLIGTIAAQVDGTIETIIVTGDMDTLQLIDDSTKVYTMSRGLADSVVYDAAAVEDRYGLKVEQMIDYKALRGDPSDNIPGVRGIGEKTAVEILREFGTIEAVYEYVDNYQSASSADKLSINNSQSKEAEPKIKERIIKLLSEHKEEAFMSKMLATIKRDVDCGFDLEKARFGKFDLEEAAKLFSEFEFKSLLARLNEVRNLYQGKGGDGEMNNNEGQEVVDKFERNRRRFKYVLVDDDEKFAKFLTELKKQKSFTIDTETSSFDQVNCDLLGISFSWKEGEAHFVSITNYELRITNQGSNLFNYQQGCDKQMVKKGGLRKAWLESLRGMLEDEKIKKHGHNIKFDWRVLRHQGIEVAGVDFDTMIASYLLNPGSRQHSLDSVVFTEFGFEKISTDDLLGKGRDRISFAEVDKEKLNLYSGEDADFTERLVAKLKKELAENELTKLFEEIEMPLVGVLAEMEDAGIKIDQAFLANLGQEVNQRIKRLEKEIHALAGEPFNIKSTKQLKEILFAKLEISSESLGRTKTGISTAADELEKLKDSHPIIRLLLEYRELTKLASTYIEALPKLINPTTKRVHTSYNQAVTATGRLSSTDPNLQNIPIRTDLGREIRKAFVAEKGYKLASLDYSQIELRLAAHIAKDDKMIAAFQEGKDIHAATAAAINQVAEHEVTKEMRRAAKATNFGILYGQGARGLAQTADIPYAQAKQFIADYFAAFPSIKGYVEKTITEAAENGYVETLFGRRRYLPEINSSVAMVKKSAERMAVNTPIQGTAADMIKLAMIKAAGKIAEINQADDDSLRMLLQVHDELVFEIKEDKVEQIVPVLQAIMAGVLELAVPVVVDAKVGDNWGEMGAF